MQGKRTARGNHLRPTSHKRSRSHSALPETNAMSVKTAYYPSLTNVLSSIHHLFEEQPPSKISLSTLEPFPQLEEISVSICLKQKSEKSHHFEIDSRRIGLAFAVEQIRKMPWQRCHHSSATHSHPFSAKPGTLAFHFRLLNPQMAPSQLRSRSSFPVRRKKLLQYAHLQMYISGLNDHLASEKSPRLKANTRPPR